jgi:hypothetical protein
MGGERVPLSDKNVIEVGEKTTGLRIIIGSSAITMFICFVVELSDRPQGRGAWAGEGINIMPNKHSRLCVVNKMLGENRNRCAFSWTGTFRPLLVRNDMRSQVTGSLALANCHWLREPYRG